MQQTLKVILLLTLFSSCFWEEPREPGSNQTFATNTHFFVYPDTTDIKVNDTIWFEFKASDAFIAPNGTVKIISNANFLMNAFLYKKAEANPDFSWERAPVTACKILPLKGYYKLHSDLNSIQSLSPAYLEGSYQLKLGFVPIFPDTYWLEVNAAKLIQDDYALTMTVTMENVKQNIELLLPSLAGYADYPTKRPYIYAFVAH